VANKQFGKHQLGGKEILMVDMAAAIIAALPHMAVYYAEILCPWLNRRCGERPNATFNKH